MAIHADHMSQKWGHFYFLNNFVKHWPIWVVFGVQNHKEN